MNSFNIRDCVADIQIVEDKPVPVDVEYNFDSAGELLYNYAVFVNTKARPFSRQFDNIHHACLGMATEGGEALGVAKKIFAYGQTLDTVNKKGVRNEDHLIEEMGDLLFYLQLAANHLGITLLSLLESNKHKLNQRYAGAFTPEEAASRNDKEEEETQEELFQRSHEEKLKEMQQNFVTGIELSALPQDKD